MEMYPDKDFVEKEINQELFNNFEEEKDPEIKKLDFKF
jgi:hypothetical protein